MIYRIYDYHIYDKFLVRSNRMTYLCEEKERAMTITKKMLIVFCLAACGQKTQSPLTLQQRKAVEAEVRTSVTDIYQEVFGWYNDHRDDLCENEFDDIYLTEEFLSLQNQAIGIGNELDDIPPTLDYDHWIQAQDWDIVEAAVDSVQAVTADSACVYLTIKNAGTSTSIRLVVKKTAGHSRRPARWYIDDFISGDMPLSDKETLRAYIRENS